jgi:hypothetical protein
MIKNSGTQPGRLWALNMSQFDSSVDPFDRLLGVLFPLAVDKNGEN